MLLTSVVFSAVQLEGLCQLSWRGCIDYMSMSQAPVNWFEWVCSSFRQWFCRTAPAAGRAACEDSTGVPADGCRSRAAA